MNSSFEYKACPHFLKALVTKKNITVSTEGRGVKMNTILMLIILLICPITWARNLSLEANQVEAIGVYRDWGRQYDMARECARYDAEIQCSNKSVKQITNWIEGVHCVEGQCTTRSSAIFECLAEVATPPQEKVFCVWPEP